MLGLESIMQNETTPYTLHLDAAGVHCDEKLKPYLTASPNALIIHVPDQVRLRLLLVNQAPVFSLHIQLAAGAILEYGLLTEAVLAQNMQIKVVAQAGAHLKGEHALLSQGQYQEEMQVELQGEAAQLHLRGLQYGRAHGQLSHQLQVNHAADHTVSDIEFRAVADGQSYVGFRGLIYVPKTIKGVDANEQTRSILLSSQAEIQAKPELEIYSGEIACRHGATVGSLDENALFYLQSRGFSEAESRHVLIEAFVGSIFNLIQLEAL
jgi:Fe-S cluster assembly protein SufD